MYSRRVEYPNSTNFIPNVPLRLHNTSQCRVLEPLEAVEVRFHRRRLSHSAVGQKQSPTEEELLLIYTMKVR